MSLSVTIDLDEEVVHSLDRLAARTERSRDDLLNEALQDYLRLQEWQLGKITVGIEAADRGDFVGDDEIARIAEKYSASPPSHLDPPGSARS
jgi:predicted transcriptional regulator